MARYVSLINWTDQGVKNYKDTVDRADAAREIAEKLGGRFEEIYWTLGAYDIVAISEFPDDETGTAFLLAVAAIGNIRTTTLRAFDADEMRGIISKTG
jgi:uncharacterized protein with GYD domain